MSFFPAAVESGFDLSPESSRRRVPIEVEPLFRIAVIGDFRGQVERETPLRYRQPLSVTLNDLDLVMARLQPALTLPLDGGESATLTFRQLRDFHPDSLWLSDACAHLRKPSPPSQPAARLRAFYRHPDFRALEARWRGLAMLAERVAHLPAIEIRLIDLSRQELTADLTADADLHDTALHFLLVDACPYSLIVADFDFAPALDDLALLHPLGRIGKHAQAPVLAAARLSADSCSSPCPAMWREFQETAAAGFVGLAYPRFLARSPYSTGHPGCQLIDFTEWYEDESLAHLCWANPAWLCAVVAAQAFLEGGDCLQPGYLREVEGLPVCWRPLAGGAVDPATAEFRLEHAHIVALLERGLIPVLADDAPGSVRILEFQAVSRARLTGRWTHE
jgi:hypothetical protein